MEKNVTITEANKAGRKPATVKPGVRNPTSQSMSALTKNKNRPSVKTVRGKVKITKIGRTIALTKPKTSTAIAASDNLLLLLSPV